jgi:predicted amidohydrolase YtcJ
MDSTRPRTERASHTPIASAIPTARLAPGSACRVALLAGLAIAHAHADASDTAPADLVLRGSAIVTLDPAAAHANAVAVRAGRIVFVGDAHDVRAYIGERTRTIELGRRMLLPAFHDTHMHPMSGGMRLLRCSLADIAATQAAVDAITACARRWPSTPWLIVNGLSEELAGSLDLTTLDRIVADRPLAITIGPGFSMRVNTRALALAGFDKQDADTSKRSDIERANGQPSGLVSGDAAMAVRRLWPRPTADEYREALRRTSAMANRYGIVSILDANVDSAMLDAYRAADAAGELSVRVVAAQRVTPDAGIAQIEAMRNARDAIHSRNLRADAAKIFLDGEISLHTAALLEPYSDDPKQRGDLFVEPHALDALVANLDRAGFDVHLPVIGDRAVRTGLDAIAHAIDANGARDRRHELAHDPFVDQADLPRFAALGVIANVQPAWAWADTDNRDNELKLGPRRAAMLMPLASLVRAHARIVASSDWPSPVMNPLEAMQVAITRRPLDGSAPAWHPRERVDLMQMLRAYCSDAAWALRLEHESGSITVGKSADLVVLDRDVRRVEPMKIHDARVLLTLLDGKAVYESPTLAIPLK